MSNSELVEKVFVLRKDPLDIGIEKVDCISIPKLVRIRPFYWFLTAFYGIYLIKKRKANLILSYNIYPHGFNGYFASLFTKLPFIYAEISEFTTGYFKNPFERFLIKKVLKQAERILVPGSVTGNFWKHKGYSNLTYLHSTIDPQYFKPNFSVKKEYDFIFIGVLNSIKRPNIIIDAFFEIKAANNPIISLCIIGYGDLQAEIAEQINNLDLKLNITLINTNDVLDYLLKSKILVLASSTEGIPCAMLEAMACELIVVVPPVGDIADVIEHKVNGFLHDNSKEDIKKQMMTAFTDYETIGNVRKNARETIISQHSYQVATECWTELLEKL